MSYDGSDARYDAYMEQLISDFHEEYGPQIADEAVDGFQSGRIQSYFLTQPRLSETPQRQLVEAQTLLADGHSDAAVVFAVSAMEIGLKEALMKPIVYGLV